MKVYQRNGLNIFSYPQDMAEILNYLNKHGKVYVSDCTIEKLYREFSEEKYCAGWMGIVGANSVDEWLLQDFEDWLNDYEL